ncbi:hypothetical protein ASB1_14700 [Helicobacter heilmannii]|nr:hypothetical protein ASB1_14700 [Helicobacter heilmannii]
MDRVVDLEKLEFEEQESLSLRPHLWQEYIGQEPLKKLLQVSINATKKRGDTLDHILFFGPPGLGKTTLSHIIAKELNTPIKVTTAPMIEKTGDLAALLTNLKPQEILFIDEIHRLSPAIEEVLYPAMEDFRLDIIIGSKAATDHQDRPSPLHAHRRDHEGGDAKQPLKGSLWHAFSHGILQH